MKRIRAVSFVMIYIFMIYHVHLLGQSSAEKNSQIGLRTFPYPYKAALTIADDIDRQDWEDFLYIQEFYSRYDLEIGETFWMYHDTDVYPSPDIEFSYFRGNTRKRSQFAADMIQYMRSGIFDAMHTFEQTQPRESSNLKRSDYKYAIEELRNRIGVRIKHWINHGDSPDKIGSDALHLGDNYESAYYHTDFTNVKKSNEYYSFEFYHGLYKSYDDPCYVLPNNVLSLMTLDDGSPAYVYSRYHGVVDPPRSNELHIQLSEENLNSLVKNGGVTILYMHLGTVDVGKPSEDGYDHGIDEVYPPLDELGEERLIALSEYQKKGKIYVTTSSKLLQYLLALNNLDYSVHGTDIVIHAIEDEVRGQYVPTFADLQGITFYTSNPADTRVFIGSQEVTDRMIRFPSDGVAKSLGFPLIRLTRPTDYPRLFNNVQTRIYTTDGIYHAVSYDRIILDRELMPRIKMKVQLEYRSGELVITPKTDSNDEIVFEADGTTPLMRLMVFDDSKNFRVKNARSYVLNRDGIVLNQVKAKESQIDFGIVPVGGTYTIKTLKD